MSDTCVSTFSLICVFVCVKDRGARSSQHDSCGRDERQGELVQAVCVAKPERSCFDDLVHLLNQIWSQECVFIPWAVGTNFVHAGFSLSGLHLCIHWTDLKRLWLPDRISEVTVLGGKNGNSWYQQFNNQHPRCRQLFFKGWFHEMIYKYLKISLKY